MSTNSSIHTQEEIKAEPSPTPPPPMVLLSFGNILEKFPEFLLQVLSYIPDRIVWNSIASSHKKIYEKSKQEAYPPPWPANFKLYVPGNNYYEEMYHPVWSPDGTQIACSTRNLANEHRIVIFDQRRGLLRFRHHGDEINDNNVNEIGWIAHEETYVGLDLKFSPDGSFLISACDSSVKIWDYDSTDGYYRQLQDWNIYQEFGREYRHVTRTDVSPCCRYVAILYGMSVLLKDVQNGKTITSLLLPENEVGMQLIFSNIDDRSSILFRSWDDESGGYIIRIWRPYAIVDDENMMEGSLELPISSSSTTASLITIWENYGAVFEYHDFALSHDSSMIAIFANGKVMLYSIDNGSKLILKQSFSGWNHTKFKFTPGDKYITYFNGSNNGLGFWNVNTGRDITDPINVTKTKPYSKNEGDIFLIVYAFAPAGSTSSQQRVLVKDNAGRYYITSFWEKSH
ncbi:hypothetical protein FRACYDRAFT_245843 [Fragilariopsis cylindrus CCMP1102]|uniref:WD40 repeat-like protein n=1 Tax=Fragilariopsis cylindrus CCMP1102 TaxID=635003 RepID=A0A1E7F0Q9_9STRA|nr:hypothetical protein FRACYDRAFT_245843 [Fragilariopsis cylindrus CCMP1102]|eukprot:OEU11383.1 hypothetical protein FRACYDRAFT_245843 [Fragilariopsis cylindrus CCMP1102]